MNGREMYALYRNAHAGDTGIVLPTFDDLSHQQRMVWERLGEAAEEAFIDDLRERGVMWEPAS
jgi:hypothetical protein